MASINKHLGEQDQFGGNYQMKVSVITATYNSAKTLRDTLDSILAQTYPDIESIIVDGASKDGTMDIVREYETRFEGRMRWISEPDKGIYDAMNKGIKMAGGDVIGVLNSDDFYHDERVVEDIVNAFDQKNVDCIYGNLVFIDVKDKNNILRIWKGTQHECGAFLRGWHPAHPTCYAKRIWFERFGGFNLQYAISADFELMLRFIEKGQIRNAYLDRYFVKMRMGGESTGSIRNIIKGNRNILRALRDNGFKPSRFYLIKRLIPKAWDMLKYKLKNILHK